MCALDVELVKGLEVSKVLCDFFTEGDRCHPGLQVGDDQDAGAEGGSTRRAVKESTDQKLRYISTNVQLIQQGALTPSTDFVESDPKDVSKLVEPHIDKDSTRHQCLEQEAVPKGGVQHRLLGQEQLELAEALTKAGKKCTGNFIKELCCTFTVIIPRRLDRGGSHRGSAALAPLRLQ